MTHPLDATVLGFPRIGPNRELKKAVEAYWSKDIDQEAMDTAADAIGADIRKQLSHKGLTSVPSNIFSWYDHVLDTAVMVDAVPHRYEELGLSPMDTYFAMARGTDQIAPLELTKWFDTNYHYLVPEIGPSTRFTAVPKKPLREYRAAKEAGTETRPVLLGPATFLLLAKADETAPENFEVLSRLDELTDTYLELLHALADAGAEWVQLDEPALNLDRNASELAAIGDAYNKLAAATDRPKLLVTGGYGAFEDALPVLLKSGVEAIALDLVHGSSDLERLAGLGPVRDTTIVAGLVDGRNIWRTDLAAASATLATLLGLADHIGVSSSCSLLHVPLDLSLETHLEPNLVKHLAFAAQKIEEVTQLSARITGDSFFETTSAPPEWRNSRVRTRLNALRPTDRRRTPYHEREPAQAARLRLPALPVTTIGSFPQTADIRRTRSQHRRGLMDDTEYRERMQQEIKAVISVQEQIGLDVLVHGEPERNDMVQYFAEALDGFATTDHGWVQSYGSRCVRPPILYGDVSRPNPMTVEWSRYAQSLTEKPVKGMLTGPVTILAWSFVRNDQPLSQTADQVALALRDEVRDLESAGIRIIQVDEPALRESLPLRTRDQTSYLQWAVEAFRLATSGVADDTQIHTHLCYSEFGEVIDSIADLDADVTSIEASRSKMEVLNDLAEAGYHRGVGPGVYDIHSPRIPDTSEVTDSLRAALRAVPSERLWVNPDCGLKTRGYPEVEAALNVLVASAGMLREAASAKS